MVNCKTVFTENGENKAEFEKFYTTLEELSPNIAKKAKKLTFGGGCFFYVIEGKNATYYAIAEAVRRIVTAIVRDEDAILPVSVKNSACALTNPPGTHILDLLKWEG